MSNETAQTTEATKAKTVIRPHLQNYVRAKSAAGKRSHRIDDFTARTLDGKSLEEIKRGAALLGIDHAKWSGLNNGQQRMLIGNAIRNRLSAKKDPIEEQAVTIVFGAPSDPYDAEKAAAAKAEAEAAREAKKAEKAAAKEAREAAAAAKAADAEKGIDPAPSRATHRTSGKSKKS